MLDLIDNLVDGATDTLRGVVLLLSIVMVMMVWMKTKSFAPTIGAIIFGGFMLWGVYNTEAIGNLFGEQIDDETDDVEVRDIDLNQ